MSEYIIGVLIFVCLAITAVKITGWLIKSIWEMAPVIILYSVIALICLFAMIENIEVNETGSETSELQQLGEEFIRAGGALYEQESEDRE